MHNNELTFIIEGKAYVIKQEYLTGREIKELAGLPPEGELFLTISRPWKDEPIENDQKVNLARPGIEQFFIKKKLEFRINHVLFETQKQFISLGELKKMGNIDDSDQVFLAITGGYEDELIQEGVLINLARPGTEHFYSKPTKKTIEIIVNGTPHVIEKDVVSYKEVVTLAFPEYPSHPERTYSVTYTNGPSTNHEGILSPGATVKVKNKMKFHVKHTGQS